MQETTTNNIDIEAVKYFDTVNEILYKKGYINGNHYIFENNILSDSSQTTNARSR